MLHTLLILQKDAFTLIEQTIVEIPGPGGLDMSEHMLPFISQLL